ncbi:MAG: hypothetical protein LBU89_08435 [Fibromonadaceae bacterium]|nr:hypothetical protein [Fibromonadaceae bacterium]
MATPFSLGWWQFPEPVVVEVFSEGYLKKSYPSELALRTPLLKLSAKGIRVEVKSLMQGFTTNGDKLYVFFKKFWEPI